MKIAKESLKEAQSHRIDEASGDILHILAAILEENPDRVSAIIDTARKDYGEDI